MVIVVLLDGARCPAKCSLRLPKTGRVSDLVRVSAGVVVWCADEELFGVAFLYKTEGEEGRGGEGGREGEEQRWRKHLHSHHRCCFARRSRPCYPRGAEKGKGRKRKSHDLRSRFRLSDMCKGSISRSLRLIICFSSSPRREQSPSSYRRLSRSPDCCIQIIHALRQSPASRSLFALCHCLQLRHRPLRTRLTRRPRSD